MIAFIFVVSETHFFKLPGGFKTLLDLSAKPINRPTVTINLNYIKGNHKKMFIPVCVEIGFNACFKRSILFIPN